MQLEEERLVVAAAFYSVAADCILNDSALPFLAIEINPYEEIPRLIGKIT